jgi:hypothetical protein
MKIKDIIKEGILSKMMGGTPSTRELANKYNLKQAQIASAPPNWDQTSGQTQTTQTTQTTPKQDPIQRDKQPIAGFDVISHDPLIVRYDKIDYTLNDKGEWGKLVQGRREPAPLSQSLTRALDKVAGLVDNPQAEPEPEPETVRSELPDISQLSPQEREELKKRLKASLKVSV